MIAKLTGRVESIEPDRCVIDVGGVGYLVQASTRTLAALPTGEVAAVLVDMQVREDAITLYGFSESSEREWFRLLTTVQGVGARVALNILSALSPRDLVGAIQAGDRASLTRAAGVGARLAIRLLTELRERAGAMPTDSGVSPVFSAYAGGTEGDAISALLHLGYRRPEAAATVARTLERLGAETPVEIVIREGLKELAPR